MLKSRIFDLGLAAFLLGASISALASLSESYSLKTTDTWFFIGHGKPILANETQRLDSSRPILHIGQSFGCMTDFEPINESLYLVAELRGPESLRHFHPEATSVAFSADNLSVISTLEIDGNQGSTGFWYSVDPGDPLGQYELTCKLGGVPVGHYEFIVE